MSMQNTEHDFFFFLRNKFGKNLKCEFGLSVIAHGKIYPNYNRKINLPETILIQ